MYAQSSDSEDGRSDARRRSQSAADGRYESGMGEEVHGADATSTAWTQLPLV